MIGWLHRCHGCTLNKVHNCVVCRLSMYLVLIDIRHPNLLTLSPFLALFSRVNLRWLCQYRKFKSFWPGILNRIKGAKRNTLVKIRIHRALRLCNTSYEWAIASCFLHTTQQHASGFYSRVPFVPSPHPERGNSHPPPPVPRPLSPFNKENILGISICIPRPSPSLFSFQNKREIPFKIRSKPVSLVVRVAGLIRERRSRQK